MIIIIRRRTTTIRRTKKIDDNNGKTKVHGQLTTHSKKDKPSQHCQCYPFKKITPTFARQEYCIPDCVPLVVENVEKGQCYAHGKWAPSEVYVGTICPACSAMLSNAGR